MQDSQGGGKFHERTYLVWSCAGVNPSVEVINTFGVEFRPLEDFFSSAF